MKVLFLDVDGVLNCNSTREKIGRGRFANFHGLDAKLLRRFKLWHNRYSEVKIVVSSTWREDPDCLAVLREAIPVHDVTILATGRQKEVQHYLNTHPEVEKYAILDDIQFFRGKMAERFVQTGGVLGLQDKHLDRVSELLGLE